MTLDGVMTVMLRYSTEFDSFEGQLHKSLRQKCSPKNLVFKSNVSFMAIFTKVTENECINDRHLLSKSGNMTNAPRELEKYNR